MDRDYILEKEMRIAEEIFGTEKDPDQMPINEESVKKLDSIYEGWLGSVLDEEGEPIAWSVVLPTQTELMDKFLNNEITEKQLLEKTKPEDVYNSLYVASVITVPEQRSKGFATKVLSEAIERAPLVDNAVIFAWPWSVEGRSLFDKIKSMVKKDIRVKI